MGDSVDCPRCGERHGVAEAHTCPKTVENLEEFIDELIPFVRHSPGCPAEQPPRGESACLCSLDGTLGMAFEPGRVIMCSGCGCHAINGDGSEDWAHRRVDDRDEYRCEHCALSAGGY